MRIIKEGNKPDIDTERFFECRYCGCMFYANKDEYKWVWTDRFKGEPIVFLFNAVCPCCKMIASSDEKKVL